MISQNKRKHVQLTIVSVLTNHGQYIFTVFKNLLSLLMKMNLLLAHVSLNKS